MTGVTTGLIAGEYFETVITVVIAGSVMFLYFGLLIFSWAYLFHQTVGTAMDFLLFRRSVNTFAAQIQELPVQLVMSTVMLLLLAAPRLLSLASESISSLPRISAGKRSSACR